MSCPKPSPGQHRDFERAMLALNVKFHSAVLEFRLADLQCELDLIRDELESEHDSQH